MKKITYIIIFIVIVVFLIISLSTNQEENNENQEEVLDGQIVLYFLNKDTNELEKEYRYVKMSDIRSDMVGTILRELQKGPTLGNLTLSIPNGTKINNVKIEEDTVILDLSKEFIDNNVDDNLSNAISIYSIVNSLTEITEINNVKFLIDGEEREKFKDNFKFNESFTREI